MNRQQFREFSTTNHLQFDAVERNILLADNKVFWPELEGILRKRSEPSKMGDVVLRGSTKVRSLLSQESMSDNARDLSADQEARIRQLKARFEESAPDDGRMARFEFEMFCEENDLQLTEEELGVLLSDGVVEWDELEVVLRNKFVTAAKQ